jgi:ankyrin repeat protein
MAVASGAAVNAVHGRSRQSALHVAAALGRTSLIQFLVDHGAILDLADRQGQTALGIAENPARPRKDAADLLRALARQR